MKHWTSNSC
uniref:Fructose-6-phosphate-2-kinase/fructose-2, 6-bisphosphatase n=1 Tax=Arundo donax TaxID=35708 RepID=A0A0A8ZR98_ARUDO